MIIRYDFPPMFDEIEKVFGPSCRRAIFCWGEDIYNPSGIKVTESLRAHEGVHQRQQAAFGGPEKWWRRYLDDPKFRLAEEIPAHIVEYQVFCQDHMVGPARNQRRMALFSIARRLSSPLYGSLIPYERARKLIREAAR